MEYGKLIHGISDEDYTRIGRELRAMRSSMLKPGMNSMAHLKAYLENPRKETEALRIGHIFHDLLRTPKEFMDRVKVKPKFVGWTKGKDPHLSENSAEAKEKEKIWLSSIPRETHVLDQEEADMIIGMVNGVVNHALASKLLENAVSETSCFVKCPETGVDIQFRPDYIAEKGYIIDIKSAISVHPDEFIREIFATYKRFYILNAAHYCYGAKLAKLPMPDKFTFIAVEKTPPYSVNVFPMDFGMLAVGEKRRDPVTKQYSECLKTNVWPGYPQQAVPVTLPRWVDYQEEKELE